MNYFFPSKCSEKIFSGNLKEPFDSATDVKCCHMVRVRFSECQNKKNEPKLTLSKACRFCLNLGKSLDLSFLQINIF